MRACIAATDVDGCNPEFWAEFHGAAVWKKFVHLYGASPANLERIVAILDRLYPSQEYFTIAQVEDVFKTAIDSGGSASDRLDRIPVQVDGPFPEPKPVPVDRNGKPLTAAQLAWSEMRIWSETASQTQRKERMRVDAAYRNFVQKNREREFEGVGDSVVELNPHMTAAEYSKNAVEGIAAKAGLLLPDLMEWVRQYQTMPVSKVRSLRSAAINPIGYEHFENCFQTAIKAGLI